MRIRNQNRPRPRPENIPDPSPPPSDLAAESIDGPAAAPRPLPMLMFAGLISAIAEESVPLANAFADEYQRALRLPDDAQILYRPPSLREMARRAGVPYHVARRVFRTAVMMGGGSTDRRKRKRRKAYRSYKQ